MEAGGGVVGTAAWQRPRAVVRWALWRGAAGRCRARVWGRRRQHGVVRVAVQMAIRQGRWRGSGTAGAGVGALAAGRRVR